MEGISKWFELQTKRAIQISDKQAIQRPDTRAVQFSNGGGLVTHCIWIATAILSSSKLAGLSDKAKKLANEMEGSGPIRSGNEK